MALDNAPQERSAWIMLVLAAIGYPVYVVLVLVGADGRPLPDAPFAWPMVWVIVGSVVASMVLHAIFRVYTDAENGGQDERDVLIDRWAERIGNSLVVLGGLGALVLLMFDAPAFWPANSIYLGFFASAILSSIAKIAAYRGGFSPTS